MDSLAPKLARIFIDPRRWKKLVPHIKLYAKNIFVYRSLSTNLNSLNYWNKKLSDRGSSWRVHPYEHLISILPKEQAYSILDIGCGLGDGVIFLKEQFPKLRLEGLDFSDVGIKMARKKSGAITWHNLDILRASIPDAYDYILIIRTLEHFDNPFIVLDKCLQATRKSVIVNVPYDKSSNSRIYGVTEHRYHFDKSTFSDYKCRDVRIVDDGKSIIYVIDSDS